MLWTENKTYFQCLKYNWVLLWAFSSQFEFLMVYESSLQKSVINFSFILLIFAYAYAYKENRGCDSIHKPQENHLLVVIKELLYKNSSTTVVYLNTHATTHAHTHTHTCAHPHAHTHKHTHARRHAHMHTTHTHTHTHIHKTLNCSDWDGVHGGTPGRGTVLPPGNLQFQYLTRSWGLFTDLILLPTLWPWGKLSL